MMSRMRKTRVSGTIVQYYCNMGNSLYTMYVWESGKVNIIRTESPDSTGRCLVMSRVTSRANGAAALNSWRKSAKITKVIHE
jgi:hypothetical protein